MWISISLSFLVSLSLVGISRQDLISDILPITTNPDQIKFYLFPNQTNIEDFDTLTYNELDSITRSRYSSEKDLIFVTHGFRANATSGSTLSIIKAYLSEGYTRTTNILGVDWGDLSGNNSTDDPIPAQLLASLPLYITASNNVYVAGRRIQELLTWLETESLLSPAQNIHLVGHSLGAHVSGMAALYFRRNSSRSIQRISGLDPAGPIFQLYTADNRLDRTDGAFVDITHTSQGEFGYWGPLGHVDFYMNGGFAPQPGCGIELGCAHSRANYYYAKSVLDPDILGVGLGRFPGVGGSGQAIYGQFCNTSSVGGYRVSLKLTNPE